MLKPFVFFFCTFMLCQNLFAQDTVVVYNNYKYKVGFKIIEEASWDDSWAGEYLAVTSFGFQLYKKINVPGFGIETGIGWLNKGNKYVYLRDGKDYSASFYYHNLAIPLCFRVDTKTIYASVGALAEVLVYRSRGELNYYPADSLGTIFPDRKFNLALMATIGIEKEISKTLTFFAEGRIVSDVTSSKTRYYNSNKNIFGDKPFFGDGYVNAGGAVGISYRFLRSK